MSEEEHPALYVDRGEVEEQWVEQARWPKVIGIISVVIGSLMFTCTGCGVFNTFLPMIAPGMMSNLYPDGYPPEVMNPPVTIYAQLAMGFIMNIYLVLSGITLLMRKSIARVLHLGYGLLATVFGVVGLLLYVHYQEAITEWVKQNPSTAFAQQQSSFGPFQQVMVVLLVVLSLAWPVFNLIWFGAVKRDSAEISRGASEVV